MENTHDTTIDSNSDKGRLLHAVFFFFQSRNWNRLCKIKGMLIQGSLDSFRGIFITNPFKLNFVSKCYFNKEAATMLNWQLTAYDQNQSKHTRRLSTSALRLPSYHHFIETRYWSWSGVDTKMESTRYDGEERAVSYQRI